MRLPLALACVVGLACHSSADGGDQATTAFAAAQGQVRVVVLLSPT